MKPKNILFQMTGSIACFKACAVISDLAKKGHEVQVVATPAALEFVGAATLEGLTGKKVMTKTFHEGRMMDHIYLARWADILVLCPATANSINKLAQGIADDLIGNLFLASERTKPYLVFPAMNTQMYRHPSVQTSIATLKQWGIKVHSTSEGLLACGEVGEGRLLEPEEVVTAIERQLYQSQLGKVLITAGGTREPIDDVRYIGNSSTGRTGSTLAETLASLGFEVTLVVAASAEKPDHPNIKVIPFETTENLNQILMSELETHYDGVIHAAAVSDFRVGEIRTEGTLKPKLSSDTDMSLHLVRNPKLIAKLRDYSSNKKIKIIGFKLTSQASQDEIHEAVMKLVKSSSLDGIVHNDLMNIDKASQRHLFGFFNPFGEKQKSFENTNDLAVFLGEFMQSRRASDSVGVEYDFVP